MPEVVGRLRTPRLAAAPASPAGGEVYYDTVANILYWWNGSAWTSASGGTPDFSTVPLLAPATDARNVFSGASGRVLVGGMVTGDAQPRLTIDSIGAMRWGPGNAAADVTLARTVAGVLALGTSTQAARLRIFAGSTAGVAYDATVAAEALPRFYIRGDGAHYWGDGTLTQDCVLFRNSAGELRTTDTMLAIVRGSTVASAFSAHVSGDGQRRFLVDARGQHFWGDGTSPTDAVLQRRGAKELGLVDTFLTVTRANATDLGYRSLLTAGDTFARFVIDTAGTHDWGPGNAATDVRLYRNSPGYIVWSLASGFEVTGGGYFVNRNPDFSTGLLLVGSTALSVQAPRVTFRDAQATPRSVYLGKTGDQQLAIIDNAGTQRASFDVGSAGRLTILPGALNVGGDGVSQGVISLGVNGYVSARAAAGAGGATFVSRVTGDAVDRFQAYASGQLNWGDGAATLDVILRRRGVGELATLNALFTSQQAAVGNSAFATVVTGEAQYRLIVRADGLLQWSGGALVGDTNLYRWAAGWLGTDSGLYVGNDQGVLTLGTLVSAAVLRVRVSGDVQNRLQVLADGSMSWGPGGSTVGDTNLYRSSAGSLKTDGHFTTGGQVVALGQITSMQGAAGQIVLAPGGQIFFGSAADTNLYRRAAYTLHTDGLLEIGAALVIDAQGGGPGNKMYFGVALDTNLYRSSAGVLETTSVFQLRTSAAGNFPFGIVVPGDTALRFSINGNGLLYWGPGDAAQDVYLWRAGAGILQLTGHLQVTYDVFSRFGSVYQMALAAPFALPGIDFGPPDTYIYRPANNVLNHYNGAYGTFNAGQFVVGSDRMIKSEIEPHDVPVDALLKAGIYTYRLKNTEGRHLGLVSDELPDELVSMTADPENKGGPDHRNVDLYKLTTALLATVQHLNERLTTLEESR